MKYLFPTFFKYYVFLFSGTETENTTFQKLPGNIFVIFWERVTTSTIISAKKEKNIVKKSRIEEFRYGQNNN